MASPFDTAWLVLKEDLNYLQDAIHSMQQLFGVDYDKALEMVEQMHRHQLSQAGIPQNKVMRESADASEPASGYLNQHFAKPLAIELGDMVDNMHQLQDYQQYKDDNSREVGQRTSNEAFARRGLRGSPRVPQTSEEASYANISLRESPLHGLKPFGEDEPMGATMPDPRESEMRNGNYPYGFDPRFVTGFHDSRHGAKTEMKDPFEGRKFPLKPANPFE